MSMHSILPSKNGGAMMNAHDDDSKYNDDIMFDVLIFFYFCYKS